MFIYRSKREEQKESHHLNCSKSLDFISWTLYNAIEFARNFSLLAPLDEKVKIIWYFNNFFFCPFGIVELLFRIHIATGATPTNRIIGAISNESKYEWEIIKEDRNKQIVSSLTWIRFSRDSSRNSWKLKEATTASRFGTQQRLFVSTPVFT